MTIQTATREHPILFSSEMIRAILRERNPKTMTRRLVKPQPEYQPALLEHSDQHRWSDGFNFIRTCPHGQPGDRLTVRETWALVKAWPDPDTTHVEFEEWQGPVPKRCPDGWDVVYRADWDASCDHPDDRHFRWSPSIFMPKWASRITLEIAGVRVERLQEISHEDAIAEGCQGTDWVSSSLYIVWPHTDAGELPVEEFERLWDLLYSKRATWESNPFCWVISFKKIKP